MNFFYIIFIILFTLGLAYFGYSLYKKEKNKVVDVSFKENNEFSKQITTQSVIYLFYTDWCPHCKETKEKWNTISKDPNFNKYINFVKINCEMKKNKKIEKEFNITEYPTIILVLNNKKYYFDANLEEESLKKFLLFAYKNK